MKGRGARKKHPLRGKKITTLNYTKSGTYKAININQLIIKQLKQVL